MALGGLGAAGAAIIGGVQLMSQPSPQQALQIDESRQVCLLSDIELVEGMTKGCYSLGEIRNMMERPVVAQGDRLAAVGLSHPTNEMAPIEIVNTCAKYDELKSAGWYPLSGREMRRESYFTRACGALRMLMMSSEPRETFFDKDGCTEEDMRSLAGMTLPAVRESAEATPSDLAINRTEPGKWRLSTTAEDAVMQEIAIADFNEDGLGDVLVFMAAGASGGTAYVDQLGFLEKKAPNGEVTFTAAE